MPVPPERPVLIAELEDIRSRIIASKETASTVVSGLDDEAFQRRPAEGSWSVCECIDHLVVTGEKLCGAIDPAIARAHREGKYGKEPFRYGWLEKWFARSASELNPPPRRRYRTLAAYQPDPSLLPSTVLPAYRTLQDNIVERVEAANGLDLARIRITSPATRWVRLSLGQWLHMIAGHQERHLAQAARARAAVLDGRGSR